MTTESVPVGSNTATTLTMANPTSAQIAISSAYLDGDAAWLPEGSTLDELEVLEPGATSIQLWYAPTAPGVHSTTLSIEIGDELLAVRLVGGAQYPCVSAWPLSVDFGDAASGEALVTIQNCGAALTATLGEPLVDGATAVAAAGGTATWLLPAAEEEVSLTYQATGNCEEGLLSIPVDSATGSIEIEVRGGCPPRTGPNYSDTDRDGYSIAEGDCDDHDALRSPTASEWSDGFDDDCDGQVDEGSYAFDDDGDGFREMGDDGTGTDVDCHDADQTTYPGAVEACDGLDNDCDGRIDEADDALPDGVCAACSIGEEAELQGATSRRASR